MPCNTMVIRESFMIFSRLNFKLRQFIANHPEEIKEMVCQSNRRGNHIRQALVSRLVRSKSRPATKFEKWLEDPEISLVIYWLASYFFAAHIVYLLIFRLFNA